MQETILQSKKELFYQRNVFTDNIFVIYVQKGFSIK